MVEPLSTLISPPNLFIFRPRINLLFYRDLLKSNPAMRLGTSLHLGYVNAMDTVRMVVVVVVERGRGRIETISETYFT